jgi:large subunit ribosomal protein L21
MFAVIQIGGKQYLIQEDQTIQVELLKEKEGQEITVKDILLVSNGEEVEIGEPVLSKAQVKAKIIKHGKAKKVVVFKYKKRKGYRKKQGHRQNFSEIKITKITGEKIKAKARPKTEKPVAKPVSKKTRNKKSAKK